MHSLSPKYLDALRFSATEMKLIRALAEYLGKQQRFA